MRAFKIRNPGYPGLAVPISYFALSHFVFAGVVRTKQETKKLREWISYSKSSAPNPYKGNQEMTAEGFEPTALSIPAHVLIHSGMASFSLPKRHHIHPMFSAACNQPLPEPPKIRHRAPQILKFKKSSPSISYFGGFFLYG